MHKYYLQTASFLGAFGVLMGAFGAHALKKIALPETVAIFETAVRYHMYHTFALALVGILYASYSNKWVQLAGKLFIIGLILFSGSLYALVYGQVHTNGALQWVGIITPFGGLFLITGWICLGLGIGYKK